MSDTLAALQGFAGSPLVLRQVPIMHGETVSGYVDVVSERAYRYRKGQPSELIQIPSEVQDDEQDALNKLVEVLADRDDALLEKVLEDVKPTTAEIYNDLRKDLAAGAVIEVLVGSAENAGGVRRLWKALRHDTPMPRETASRKGVAEDGLPLAQVFKTVHAGHTGKLSFARIWRGNIKDGVEDERTASWFYSGGGSQRAITLGIAVVFLGSAVILASGIGNEFMPPLNEGDIMFMPIADASISLAQNIDYAKRQDKVLESFPEVAYVAAKIARAETSTDPAGLNMTETIVHLKPRDQWRPGMTLKVRYRSPKGDHSWAPIWMFTGQQISPGPGGNAYAGFGGPNTLYRASKAALNAVVKAISLELASRGVTAIALHPGWVKTDMGGAGADIDAGTSVAGMRAVIERAESRVSGHFFDYTGKELPW